MQKRAVAILAAFLLALGAAIGGALLAREFIAKPTNDAAEYRKYRAAVEKRDAELVKALRELAARADVYAQHGTPLDAKALSGMAALLADEMERPVIAERASAETP